MLPLWRASALRMARGASASSSTSAISALANGAGGELHASVASVSRRLAAASLSTALGRCVPLLDVNQHALMTARSATAPLAYSTAAAAPQPEAPEPKMMISFKCKVCSNRTSGTMSKLAYEKGVVIIRCKHCDNLHLVADHLGWMDIKKGVTVEQILSERGEQVARLDLGDVLNFIDRNDAPGAATLESTPPTERSRPSSPTSRSPTGGSSSPTSDDRAKG